jgi:hypothetical protein
MDFCNPIRFNRYALANDLYRQLEQVLAPFAEALDAFLASLFQGRLPGDWREQWRAFVIEQESAGFLVEPESTDSLEQWIEDWARFCELLPRAESSLTAIVVSSGFEAESAKRSSPLVEPSSMQIAAITATDAHSQPAVPAKPQQTPAVKPEPARKQKEAERPATKSPSLSWPKLTPEEIERIETAAGRRWWYPLVPSGETDWVWLSKLEGAAQSARMALVQLYSELAELGRMAGALSDSQDEEIEALAAQHDKIQPAYDQYIECLIKLENIWKEYLLRVNVIIGVHVIGLKEKIDRALPSHVEGLQSAKDEEFKKALVESAQALRKARGNVEGAYTALVWADRGVIAAQLALPLVAAARQIFAASLKAGLTKAAALKAAVKSVAKQAAGAVAIGAAVGEGVPRVLEGFGVDEADARAGITIFFALVALRGAVASAKVAGRGKTPRHGKDSKGPVPPKDMPSDVPELEPGPPRVGTFHRPSVWDLGPTTRGEIISDRCGENLPKGFPVIDRFVEGIVASIKSTNLRLKSYQKGEAVFNLGRKYVDKVAAFKSGKRKGYVISEDEIEGRELEWVIPPGATKVQRAALDAVSSYGKSVGVTVEIIEIE